MGRVHCYPVYEEQKGKWLLGVRGEEGQRGWLEDWYPSLKTTRKSTVRCLQDLAPGSDKSLNSFYREQ